MDRRLLLLGFVAALAVLVTTRHGVGIDADSVAYVDLASHLRAGNGFALSPGLTTMADPHALRPTAHFPPLYPALLAAGEATGLGAWTVTRWLGIVLAAVNAMLVGVVIRDAGASWGRALVAVLLMVTAVDWLRVHSWALTEPLFLAGVVVTLGALARQIRVPSPRCLLAHRAESRRPSVGTDRRARVVRVGLGNADTAVDRLEQGRGRPRIAWPGRSDGTGGMRPRAPEGATEGPGAMAVCPAPGQAGRWADAQHHGLSLLKRAVEQLGVRPLDQALDPQSPIGQALAEWRRDLTADLGGRESITTAQAALVELAL